MRKVQRQFQVPKFVDVLDEVQGWAASLREGRVDKNEHVHIEG